MHSNVALGFKIFACSMRGKDRKRVQAWLERTYMKKTQSLTKLTPANWHPGQHQSSLNRERCGWREGKENRVAVVP